MSPKPMSDGSSWTQWGPQIWLIATQWQDQLITITVHNSAPERHMPNLSPAWGRKSCWHQYIAVKESIWLDKRGVEKFADWRTVLRLETRGWGFHKPPILRWLSKWWGRCSGITCRKNIQCYIHTHLYCTAITATTCREALSRISF